MTSVRYYKLLLDISKKLDEPPNDIEGLTFICRGKIAEGKEDSIINARALFLELERQGHLGIDCLDVLREMLKELGEWELLIKVLEFESTRAEVRELEEERYRMEGKSAYILTSAKWAGKRMLGEIKLHCNFRTITGGVLVVGAVVILRKCSTLSEFMDAFTKVVLPATTKLCAIAEGSVCFTVQAENLSALQVLWQQYEDGTLQKNLQDFLITEEINQLADGQKVMVNVNIDEQEYKEACLDLMITETKVLNKEALSPRRRRNSDSVLLCRSMDGEEEVWKLRKSELPEGKVKGKSHFGDMEPERIAYVQRYLEKLEDTYSEMSEITDDSGFGTKSAPSELGAGKDSVTNLDQEMEYSNEELNYFRICYITTHIITEGLRSVFKQEWNIRYQDWLGSWQDTAKNGVDFYYQETTARRGKGMNPPRGMREIMKKGNTEEWDCTALFFGILYSECIGASLKAAISNHVTDLRVFHNVVFAHNVNGRISNIDFQLRVAKVEAAFVGLNLPIDGIRAIANQMDFEFPTKEVSNLKKYSQALQEESKALKEKVVALEEMSAALGEKQK